jgi:hypothetical protein
MTKEKHFTAEEFFKAVSKPLPETYTTHREVQEIDTKHKTECRGTHLKPKKTDLISFFNPTISCFCQKPANRYYTLEYGPILECASYNKSSPHYNPKYMCGFHVHELSWIKLHVQMKQGYSVCSRYTELRACPLYNFTYCAMFKVKNDYKTATVNIPTCFCGKPVKMVHDEERVVSTTAAKPAKTRHHHHHQRRDIEYETLYISNFICSNRTVAGAQKCNFLNSADKSVFPKPKVQLHKEVDYDKYTEQRELMRKNVASSVDRLSMEVEKARITLA